jgi:hypothetical protein
MGNVAAGKGRTHAHDETRANRTPRSRHLWWDAGFPRYTSAGSVAIRLPGGGDTLDEFLRQFPAVQREQAIALLDLAREALAADAPAA